MMLYLKLFLEFFKTGLFAVGGGMATIPFLYDMADATGWFTDTDLANMIAVGVSGKHRTNLRRVKSKLFGTLKKRSTRINIIYSPGGLDKCRRAVSFGSGNAVPRA